MPLVLAAAGAWLWRAEDVWRWQGADAGIISDGLAAEAREHAVSIFRCGDQWGRTLPRRQWRTLHREPFDGWLVTGLAPWDLPGGGPAFLVTLDFGLGAHRCFVILAQPCGNAFVPVLEFERESEERNLEVVDLDGDDVPEVIGITDRVYRAPSTRFAVVWKWSPSRVRYVKVRESSDADRLKPLRLKGFH